MASLQGPVPVTCPAPEGPAEFMEWLQHHSSVPSQSSAPQTCLVLVPPQGCFTWSP